MVHPPPHALLLLLLFTLSAATSPAAGVDGVMETKRRLQDALPLFHGWSSNVPGCDAGGHQDASEPTSLGGSYPFNRADSHACRAWKLAATVCGSPPTPYAHGEGVDAFSGEPRAHANWGCPASGGPGTPFCASPAQLVCSNCAGEYCNARCGGSPAANTMRDCRGTEVPANMSFPSIWAAIVFNDLAPWRGRTLSLAALRAAMTSEGGSTTLFSIAVDGTIAFDHGLDHRQRHWATWFDEVLPAAVMRADRSRFPIYIAVHGWDEPVAARNVAACKAEFGLLHANVFNPHTPSRDVPYFSVCKIPKCHRDLIIPQDGIFEDPGQQLPHVPWRDRTPRALFRGSSTGSGRHFEHRGNERHHRFRFVKLLRPHTELADVGMLDVGGPQHASRVPTAAWPKYKYILNLGGQSYGLRTALTARMNATLVESGLFVDLIVASLQERVHFVRAAFDGSDVVQLLQHLQAHDDEAHDMGEALFAHFSAHFSTAALVDHTRELLEQYSRAITFVS